MIARRANSNPLDLDTDKLLDILDITARLAGQIVVTLRTSCGLLPARQCVVSHLDLRQQFGVRWETFQLLAVDGVCSRNLELVEVVKDV